MVIRLALECLLLASLAGPVGTEKRRLDAHGFPLPQGAVARLGSLRFATRDSWAAVVALSPDGKLLARTTAPISICDAETGRVVRTVKSEKGLYPRALVWSNDGRLLASMQQTGFKVWDVATGKPHGPGGDRNLEGPERLTDLRFVADGRLLALVFADLRVELWDVARGKRLYTVVVDRKKWLRLQEFGTGYEMRHVALSPAGGRMAWLASPPATAKEGSSAVLVYDTESEKLLRVVKGLPRSERVDLADEGKTLVLYPPRPARVEAPVTQRACVVNVADGRVRFRFDHRILPPPYPRSVYFGPERVTIVRRAVRLRGPLLTIDEVGLARWDWDSGKKLDGYDQTFTSLSVSADGKRLALGDTQRFHVCDGDFAAQNKSGTFGTPPSVRFLADGRLLALGHFRERGIHNSRLHIWDTRKGALLETARIHDWPAEVEGMWCHNGSGRLVTYARKGGGFAVQDLVANKRLSLLKVVGSTEAYPLLSEDGKRVLLSGYDKARHLVRWHDARDGKELGRYEVPKGELLNDWKARSNWYAADGSLFGYLTPEHRLALVDCAARKLVRTIGLTGPGGRPKQAWRYESVGFGRLFFGRPYDIRDAARQGAAEFALWDREGHLLRRFSVPIPRHTDDRALIVSHDGRSLVVLDSARKQLVLYETVTGRRRGHIQLPDYVTNDRETHDFSPDGTLLASSCLDTTILLWDVVRPLGSKPDLVPPTSAEEAGRLWEVLGNPDPVKAEPALRALVRVPKPALAMLAERLRPAKGPDEKRIKALIARLDSDDFAVREKASGELAGLGAAALPAVRAALKRPESPEQRQRLEKLIKSFGEADPPETIRASARELRALEVLERIGTPEAKKVVEAAAAGHTSALLTREAKLVLARWR